MKYIIIAIFFITLQISHQNKFAGRMLKNYFKTHEAVKKHCLVEISVDKKLETIFEETGEIANNENLECFVKCILVTAGVMNEAGDTLYAETITKNLQLKDPTLVPGMLEKCSQFDKSDLCQGAKQFSDCCFEFLEKHL